MNADLPARPFGTLLTAMVTPFSDDGSLDASAAARLAVHAVDSGCDGLVVSGTTGESPTTTDAEKETLLRAVLDAVGDRATVVAGVGTNDTRHSVDLAEQAAKAGAHGLLVVTPYYSKPPAEGILAHFTAVADATDLPVMLYDIPGRTGVRLPAEVLERAAEHDRIVAVKDATSDLPAGADTIARTGLAYYCGDDALNLPWLCVGASGLVSTIGQVVGRPLADLVAAVDAGDLPTARSLDRRLAPAVAAIMNVTQGAIMAKAGLELLGVLSNRVMRLPLTAATEAQVSLLRDGLAASGILPAQAVAR